MVCSPYDSLEVTVCNMHRKFNAYFLNHPQNDWGEITARRAIVKVGPFSREGETTYIELKQMYITIVIKNTLLITLFFHFSAVKL